MQSDVVLEVVKQTGLLGLIVVGFLYLGRYLVSSLTQIQTAILDERKSMLEYLFKVTSSVERTMSQLQEIHAEVESLASRVESSSEDIIHGIEEVVPQIKELLTLVTTNLQRDHDELKSTVAKLSK